MNEFSIWLKEKLDKLDLGVNQVAKFAKVNSATISLAARGERIPSPATIIKLARYFKTDPDKLLAMAGHRETFDPEKEWHKVDNPDLRILLTAENLNNLSEPFQQILIQVIEIGLEKAETEMLNAAAAKARQEKQKENGETPTKSAG